MPAPGYIFFNPHLTNDELWYLKGVSNMKEKRAMKTRPRLRDHNDNKNAVGQEGKQGSCFAVPDATLLLL